jgi:hypothetical protein
MSRSHKANVSVYIQEELSDARLHCDELKRIVVKVLELINSSQKKDHFYAVAGDLIHAAPMELLKLEKSLDAAAFAVNRLDSEEIKQSLRPEKIDQLEKMLEDIRVNIPRRTGLQIRFDEQSSEDDISW